MADQEPNQFNTVNVDKHKLWLPPQSTRAANKSAGVLICLLPSLFLLYAFQCRHFFNLR
jgi:hypothetical protein